MNDLSRPTTQDVAEEQAIAAGRAIIQRTVQQSGDRGAMISEISALFAALPPPAFADRRIALAREMAFVANPGAVSRMSEFLPQVFPAASRLQDPRSELVYRNIAAVAQDHSGNWLEAQRSHLQARELARKLGDGFSYCRSSANLAVCACQAGLHHAAVTHLEHALAEAAELDDDYQVANLNHNMAHVLLRLGRIEAAFHHSQISVEHLPALCDPSETAHWAFLAKYAYEGAALPLALLNKPQRADLYLRKAASWLPFNTSSAKLIHDAHVVAVRGVTGRAADAAEHIAAILARMSAEARREYGDALAHLIYLVCRERGDTRGATAALDQLSQMFQERIRAGIAAAVTQPGMAASDEVTAFLDARAAELRLGPAALADAWDHLRDLAVSASAAEDASKLHPHRTAQLAGLLVQAIGGTEHQLLTTQRAAFLHDVGIVAVPARILETASRDAAEQDLYDRHPEFGADFIERGQIPDAGAIAAAVRYHHAPYDGQSGLPAGEALPLAARAIAVADAFDTLVTGRIGQPAVAIPQALAQILRQRGRDFDPLLVDRLIELVRQLQRDHTDVMAHLGANAE